jgi:hypothetical protein
VPCTQAISEKYQSLFVLQISGIIEERKPFFVCALGNYYLKNCTGILYGIKMIQLGADHSVSFPDTFAVIRLSGAFAGGCGLDSGKCKYI